MTSCVASRGNMGRRDRDRIRVWAEGLVQEHGAAVARLIGLDPPLPPVTIDVDTIYHGFERVLRRFSP